MGFREMLNPSYGSMALGRALEHRNNGETGEPRGRDE
jgi:hypothetical protein